MPRGYYKRNQNKTKKTPELPNTEIFKDVEEVFLARDRNKMTITELRRLIQILDERTKRDR